MKRLSMIVVLVALMGINAFAQTQQPTCILEVKANLGLAKQWFKPVSECLEDCDTFANLCVDDTLVIYSTTGNGYVAVRTNGDISKADIFYLPGANNISDCSILVLVKLPTQLTNSMFVAGIMTELSVMVHLEVLVPFLVQTREVRCSCWCISWCIDLMQFSPAIPFPADSIFYIGIDFGYKNGDTIALVQVLEKTGYVLVSTPRRTVGSGLLWWWMNWSNLGIHRNQ